MRIVTVGDYLKVYYKKENRMNELDIINKKFEDESVGIFPFISKNRVTVLDKGFHSKKEANYRGVSMVYDRQKDINKALLIGYYYVPENYVIIPEGLTITEGKRKLIQDKQRKGYTVITSFPSLKPYEFTEDSEEYAVAKTVNEKFKSER